MKLWTPDGSKRILVDKDQMPIMLRAGYTKDKPAPKPEPEKPSEPEKTSEPVAKVEKKTPAKPVAKKRVSKISK